MKFFFFIVLGVLSFVFGGCVPPYDYIDIPDLGLKTKEDVFEWVSTQISYKQDGEPGGMQDPETTYDLRTGDCEDFSILAMFLIHRVTGIRSFLVHGSGSDTRGNHFWLCVNGEWWEPQNARRCEYYRTVWPVMKMQPYTCQAWRICDFGPPLGRC